MEMEENKVMEPKPCPLCGQEIRVVDCDGVFFDFWCFNCLLSMQADTYEEGLERWNRRA